MIPADERYRKHRVRVDGLDMAYVDEGQGDPIVFLHGNPTSSYIWRNVIPHVVDQGRCIAPDLIGMGDSDKIPGSGPDSYRFVEHRRYLDGLLRALDVRERVTLVVQDWGSALGFDWARRNAPAVRGIAYMEAFVATIPSWEAMPDEGAAFLRTIRSPAAEEMVLERNFFVEDVLPHQVLRGLTEQEMAVYRRPYTEPGESRRPTLTWPREVPVAGDPGDVHEAITRYAQWLATSPVPKLFVESVPGVMFEEHRAVARSLPHQTHVTVTGSHMLQEDAPDDIGAALATWLRTLP
ncbi:haloalkane dehalogenase [Streptomyces sp. WAC06614]|uniref:haloalkane dehalogenase n=1 Tax=Streptomyces sp. WAC06614 TaxID=2487416 RepID=UPI000F7748DE|nr:haloalkane dehalogenase [Streptomyces sp. WAC06614]RSS80789.1 haloalkane dehalogenase [Streptomyces sp. WAC06614]